MVGQQSFKPTKFRLDQIQFTEGQCSLDITGDEFIGDAQLVFPKTIGLDGIPDVSVDSRLFFSKFDQGILVIFGDLDWFGQLRRSGYEVFN